MTDFHSAAVRFGKPGKLRIAPLGSTEPTDYTSAWAAAWIPLGYTAEGSNFNYSINVDNVDVAEELDILARTTTGRDANVEVALAEMTFRNLTIAFNGGIITADGTDWEFEPPDLGEETRVMLGWDANQNVADNDLRIVFRQVFQAGALNMANRKGAEKAVINASFQLEKPATGAKLLKIMGSGDLNPT